MEIFIDQTDNPAEIEASIATRTGAFMRIKFGVAGAIVLMFAITGCAAPLPHPAAGIAASNHVLRLPASRGRELELNVWPARKPVAIAVFSAGGSGKPRLYEKLLSALAHKGILVIAPVHADALARNDLSGSGGIDSFMTRIEDLAIARGYAKSNFSDVPLVVMGHSFGSMMSAVAAGAATPAGQQSDPSVKALIAFSSPGILPGVVTDSTYQAIRTPVLMVTGDKDTVRGFVSDWRNHRLLYDTSITSGSLLAVVRDANHEFIVDADGPKFDALVNLVATFIQAHAQASPAAKAKLSKVKFDGAVIERRR